MNVLKSISSRYVQNMIENMILTSYSDQSYLVTSSDGYVASIQMMSSDKYSLRDVDGHAFVFWGLNGILGVPRGLAWSCSVLDWELVGFSGSWGWLWASSLCGDLNEACRILKLGLIDLVGSCRVPNLGPGTGCLLLAVGSWWPLASVSGILWVLWGFGGTFGSCQALMGLW